MLKKKDPDNTFVKLWENKRYHALVCLGLWFIFFIFVFLIVVIPYNNTLKNLPKNNETENTITFNGGFPWILKPSKKPHRPTAPI